MTLEIKESLKQTSGNFNIFKKFLYVHTSFLGGTHRNNLKREYNFKVVVNPNKAFLDRVCEFAMIRMRSVVIGAKLRELDQYYAPIRKGEMQEVFLGKRLSLLIRSFIVWSFKNSDFTSSKIVSHFRGQPLPKMLVWIIQMIGMLRNRLHLPYSDISLVFDVEVKENGDEIEDIMRMIPELSLFGKLSSVVYGRKHSGIIVTERVLSNSAPGVLSAMSTFNEDSSCTTCHPVNVTLHDLAFSAVVGLHFHVDLSIGNYLKTTFQTDDPGICNDTADWILYSLIGDGELVETTSSSHKLTDSLGNLMEYVLSDTIEWSDGADIRDLSPGSPSDGFRSG